MKSQILIRPYEEQDKDRILKLLNDSFHQQQHLQIIRDNKWWEWKYENSVFGKPIIYVADVKQNIIGFRAFWPWKINIRGNVYNSYQPLDSAVDKEYRGQGLFTEMTKYAILQNKDHIDLIYNFPNEQSIGAYIKLGWTFVGKLQWYIKINNVFNIYRVFKHYFNFSPCELEPEDLITNEKLSIVKDNMNFNGKLKTCRNKDFLSWRYLNHPKIIYGMSIIESKRKQLTYIFEVNQNDFGRELIVVDYFGDFSLFSTMIKEINYFSSKYKVDYILLLKKYDTPDYEMRKNFYFAMKKKNFTVLPLNISLENIAIKYDNWDLFLGMHDSV